MFSAKDLFFTPAVTTGYQIAKSLRFRSSATAYLNRTPASAGATTKWTISFWLKRGALGAANYPLFGAQTGTSATQVYFMSSTADTLRWYESGGDYQTTQLFRDPSAWYHLLFVYDSTQSTATNRMKIYVNGSQVTTFSTQTTVSLNATSLWNANNQNGIGTAWDTSGSRFAYLDGYISDFYNIDGQALDPSSFGTNDATTGVWGPKAYTGTYGTNGFYLKFTDVGATSGSNAGYGKDFSGNSNYWTTNNFGTTSTATTYDSMIDSPTAYSDTVGNYAVLNPLDKGSAFTISNGNLEFAKSASTSGYEAANTIFMSSGKWYWEFTIGTITSIDVYIGMEGQAARLLHILQALYIYIEMTVKKYNTSFASYGASYTTGDIIGVAFDATNGTITFYKNNVSQGTAFTGITAGSYKAIIDLFSSASTSTSTNYVANFGQRGFAYTPPSGYVALQTYNLTAPTIAAGANYMAAVTYNGTSASNTVTTTSSNSGNNPNGITFQPDLVWIKSRSAATDNKLTDVVRGTTKAIISNSANAETTDTNGLTAFTSSGFTVGSDSTYNNGTGPATYVAWEWKGGGAGVSNTSGSVTTTVSANTTAGFSIATFTTQASGTATFGHGLGVAPSMFILKPTGSAGTNWDVYHTSLGNTQYLLLNTTGAAATASSFWNNTSPTSTVFTLGPGFAGSLPCVAYCFAPVAGYSAFGSYTGNGSTDGPFVYCGFRPRWVMIKSSSAAGTSWVIQDTTRDPYNSMGNYLYANTADAEANLAPLIDALSNGFKIRNTYGGYNTSSGTYIYAAFAENPFKYSLAR